MTHGNIMLSEGMDMVDAIPILPSAGNCEVPAAGHAASHPRMKSKTAAPMREPPFARIVRARLQTLVDDELHQVANAVAVAPLVVVPTHELEEAAVEFHAGGGVVAQRLCCVDKSGAPA